MNGPLWVDLDLQEYAPLDGNTRVDIVIVGGGFSGLGAAWSLREENASVVLLEARTLVSGASGRNAGFVLAGPALAYREAVRCAGVHGAKEIWDLTHANSRLLVRVMSDLGIECGFARRGSMSLAASQEEWQEMLLDMDVMVEAGIAVCRVDREWLPPPFDRWYSGGVYNAGNGELDPGRLLRGIARALPDSFKIHEQTPALAIERGAQWVVQTASGTVAADAVILATNAYTSQLLPNLPISPIRGQVLSTARIDRVVVPFPMYADRGYQYWRQTTDGHLVVGGWRNVDLAGEVGYEERATPDIQSVLDAFVRRVVGTEVRIDHRWAGIMGFSPDRMPLVGAVLDHNGLYIAAGYSGHGVCMAFTCGGRAARLACGDAIAIPACFHPGRFHSPTIRGA